ncbi:magnesium-translocating P-type ATPase [Anaerococcus sp. NML200574]|uniref:magnesium-translocating P-type ATPase n=1 Tax=Anaerococcus sp. NML200574 TaxID=2954486 RepID=UPI0022383C0F|nr:magnesium-translocating P-type ATPase [Anaerococcus sp. NML200574]MCW6679261.1 magnesium-translocating P-type ATPase [Anaerococcus sp. NML200574]
MKDFWSYDKDYVLKSLDSSEAGLSSKQASDRIESYGKNVFKKRKSESQFMIFLSQFKSPITMILIFAAILSIFMKDYSDGIIILIIIMISSILSYLHESKAKDAVKKLLYSVSVTSSVLRDGKFVELDNADLTFGDIISVKTGDMIPADCLLLEGNSLSTDESSLTGETFPVEKISGKIPANTTLSERKNVLWMGTHVISGSGKAVVVNLAKDSEFGKITASLSQKDSDTDFEKGIKDFGSLILHVTSLLIGLIFIFNIILNKPFLESFMFALALSVGLTPQMLPAIISVNLSQGAKRMSEEGVIVKKLNAIENFGSMTIMCSDKTGTITKGKVKLDSALNFNGEKSEDLSKFAAINSYFQEGYANPIDQAILSANKEDFSAYKKLFEIPYSFENKILSILVKTGPDLSNKNLMVTKGAFESIVNISKFYEKADGSVGKIDEIKDQIFDLFSKFSSQGYRVLGLAYKDLNDESDFENEKAEDMVFKGFLLFIDPLKEDIKEVISQMNDLGVALKMITGDNSEIAKNIGSQIGLDPEKILLGQDLSSYSISQLNKKVLDIDIFAEISPNQKEKIIRAYKEAGEIVGYMGDGINDAPAIKQADVGISVDTAADTAKDAASIVLLQNSLRVLLSGIKEGRRTFINTLKYIFVATSANFGNMFSMAGASIFLKFLPLLPKQILLTNLLTDFPSLQIASDSVDEGWLEKPVKWDMKFIKKFMIVFGITSSLFDYLTFFVLIFIFKADEKLFQTGWMLESVISAMIVMLIVRTARPVIKSKPSKGLLIAILSVSLVLISIIYSPINSYLGLVKLPLKALVSMLGISIIYALFAEVLKRKFFKHNSFSRK